jgi:hypothetical protein
VKPDIIPPIKCIHFARGAPHAASAANIVKSRWVFDLKIDEDGFVVRFKARFVAKGYSQVYGIDFFVTYSPVVARSSLYLVCSIAARQHLEIYQGDVGTAFLNGILNEYILVQQPVGFVAPDSEAKVCHLFKGLYGLKQSACTWYQHVVATLLEFGSTRDEGSVCLGVQAWG